jgi:hypothetical protein
MYGYKSGGMVNKKNKKGRVNLGPYLKSSLKQDWVRVLSDFPGYIEVIEGSSADVSLLDEVLRNVGFKRSTSGRATRGEWIVSSRNEQRNTQTTEEVEASMRHLLGEDIGAEERRKYHSSKIKYNRDINPLVSKSSPTDHSVASYYVLFRMLDLNGFSSIDAMKQAI